MCTTLNTIVQLYLKILNAPFVKELKKNVCLFVFFFFLFVWFLFFYYFFYFLEEPWTWSLKLDNKFPSKELDNKRQKHRMLLLAYFQKKKKKKKEYLNYRQILN